MADAGAHPGSAAGRALTAQDHSLVALITWRVLLLRVKHLFVAARTWQSSTKDGAGMRQQPA